MKHTHKNPVIDWFISDTNTLFIPLLLRQVQTSLLINTHTGYVYILPGVRTSALSTSLVRLTHCPPASLGLHHAIDRDMLSRPQNEGHPRNCTIPSEPCRNNTVRTNKLYPHPFCRARPTSALITKGPANSCASSLPPAQTDSATTASVAGASSPTVTRVAGLLAFPRRVASQINHAHVARLLTREDGHCHRGPRQHGVHPLPQSPAPPRDTDIHARSRLSVNYNSQPIRHATFVISFN